MSTPRTRDNDWCPATLPDGRGCQDWRWHSGPHRHHDGKQLIRWTAEKAVKP